MDMMWIMLYGKFGDLISKGNSGKCVYMIYEFQLKESPRKLRWIYGNLCSLLRSQLNLYVFYRLGDETCFRSGGL